MTERYDEQRLQKQLAGLGKSGLVMFALSIAERMLPNYRRFVRESGWGDGSVLRTALDLGWSWLENGIIEIDDAQVLRDACLKQAPNPEDFTSLFVSAALDAANSAVIVVELLSDTNIEKVIEIASYGRDTVDMYVQELEGMPPNAPDLEERIRLHAMMQRELSNQRKALKSIAAGMQPRDAADRWRSPKRGSLDEL